MAGGQAADVLGTACCGGDQSDDSTSVAFKRKQYTATNRNAKEVLVSSSVLLICENRKGLLASQAAPKFI